MTIDDKYQQINKISPSFCLAKWLQVTIDLVNGTTHSCHHPERHSIPLNELQKNSSALHNTNFKKQQRKLMLEGIRPFECSYCWKIEELGHISDRLIKSTDPWAFKHLNKVSKLPWDQNINPTYMEVMIDKKCQLQCAYCSADISSSIERELEKFGDYPVSNKKHRAKKFFTPNNREYHKAFWHWLPEVLPNLEELRITGGEPLLSDQLQTLLLFIEQHGHGQLNLSLNSNLSIPSSRFENFLIEIEKLKSMNKIKSFELFVSLDTWGKQAEYIRHGLNLNLLLKNIKIYLNQRKQDKLIFATTFNILSVTSFTQFLKYVLAIKKKFNNIIIDCSYLRDPTYLAANLLTHEFHPELDKILGYLYQNKAISYTNGFSEYEIKKIVRIVDWIKAKQLDDPYRSYLDFYFFIREYDKRFDKCFNNEYKEFSNFIKLCKNKVTEFKQMAMGLSCDT